MSAPEDNATQILRDGIRSCRQGRWREGLRYLNTLAQGEEKHGKLPGVFYSYLGHAIARCEGRKRDGLELCRHAVSIQSYRPENYLNLAHVYLMIGNRRLAYRNMNNGLALDPSHSGLLRLARQMGIRQAPVLPFLSRSNPLNHFLGQIRAHFREERAKSLRRKAEKAEKEKLDSIA